MVVHKAQDVGSRPRTEDIVLAEDIDFKSMLFPKPILQGLLKSGYRKPSPIQRKALPLVRCGLDLIVQAKAGTGKTCVFTIAVLEMVQPQLRQLQAIVLAPTREIALQVTEVISAIGCRCKGLKISSFIGGYPVSEDVARAAGCHVAVGSPGRVRHLLQEGHLNPRHVRLFVLDEADKLLEKAFISDINEIFSQLPVSKQVLALSATYSPELVSQLSAYMHSGQYVSPQQCVDSTILLGIRQYVSVQTHHLDKLAQLRLKEKHLLYLLKSIPFDQCLVFSNLHARAVSVCNMLRAQGLSAEWIAGRQEQEDRVIALAQLREQRVRVLVTTDLTARGIDAEHVNLVINLDLPRDHQTYLHRMGRAGRYGSHGMVITVLFAGEELETFQKLLGTIGGISMSVSCVPSDLKNTNLWTVPVEDLEHVCGTLQPTENNDENISDESKSETENTDHKYSQVNSNQSVNEPEIILAEQNMKGTCIKSKADSNENNFGENSADTSYGVLCSRHTTEDSVECKCNLYKADSNDIQKAFCPSLFAVADRENNWRDVLPVIVHESAIPLNVPVMLLDSKVIRVKFQCNSPIHKYIAVEDCLKKVVNFESNSKDVKFLNFEEIKHNLNNGISFKSNFETNSQEVLSFETIEKLLENGPLDCDKNTENGEVDAVLSWFKNRVEQNDNLLLGLDCFDLVGWMAVDEMLNILDRLKIQECDIYKFDLLKCSSGVSHIKAICLSNMEIEEKNDLDDSVLSLNLQDFHLSPPITLRKTAEKMDSVIRGNATQLQNDSKKFEKSNQCGRRKSKKDKVGSFNTNHVNKNHSLKLNENEGDTKQLGNALISSNISNNSSTCEIAMNSDSTNYRSKERQNLVNRKSGTKPELCNVMAQSSQNKLICKKQQNCKGSLKKNSSYKFTSRVSLETSSKSHNNKKYHKTSSESPDAMNAQRDSEIQPSFKDLSLKDDKHLLPFTDRNDCNRLSSSNSSEDSGPLTDRTPNTKTWQDLHDFDESDTGPSEEVSCFPLLPTIISDKKCSSSDSSSDLSEDLVVSKQGSFVVDLHGRSEGNIHYTSRWKSLRKKSSGSVMSTESVTSNCHRESHPKYQSKYYYKGSSTKSHCNCYNDKNHHSNKSSQPPSKVCTFCYHQPRSRINTQNKHYPGSFSSDFSESCSSSKYKEHSSYSNQNYNSHQHHSEHPRDVRLNQTLQSDHLPQEWYSSWYSKLRQRAQQLEYIEYIRVMSTTTKRLNYR